MSRCANEFAMIDQLLSLATVQLFRSVGVEVTEAPEGCARPPRTVIASTMGFSDRGLRGAITLVLERPTVAALYPELDMSGIEATRDACGELSNMLVGELKTQLRALGVTLQLGLPITVAGEGVQLFSPWSGMSSWTIFTGPGGPVRIRLDIQFTHDFVFASDAADDHSAEAGDALFF